MYNVEQVVRWFIEKTDPESGELLTPLKLQKLLYYVQAWSLALYERPVFDEKIEAWAHGPVVPKVYHALKDLGYHPIPENRFEAQNTEFEPETNELLEEVSTIYGKFDAKYLENLTHQEQPWIHAREGYEPEERCNVEIERNDMMAFYKEMQKS